MLKNMKTPILFIIFNREDTTRQVFNKIRDAKPTKLYIVADGPREKNISDKEACQRTREIIDLVDWDCKVFKNYSEDNMGCKKRVSSGIDWFFENEEFGIILEDDCLPEISFFLFCEELLEKYKNDNRVSLISGSYFNDKKIGSADYYFSKIPQIWGWATWRRTWNKYDLNMSGYQDFRENHTIEKIWGKKEIQNYWNDVFEEAYNGSINTWDYQLVFSIFVNKGLCICPNVNLVSNIGFGNGSTNTLVSDNRIAKLNLEKIEFPLQHPQNVDYIEDSDIYINNIYLKNYKIKKILKKLRLFNTIRKLYKCFLSLRINKK